jgi:hypothetical protein
MKLENKTNNSCPYCGAEAKTGMIANSFWLCGNANTHENRRSDLCREREAHNNTKRERDEWRKKFELSVDPVKIAARLAQAESERDEAKDKAEQWERIALRADTERTEAIRERDEAREQNAKLRDIAERAITAVALWAGSRTNSASELRAELERLKETK